MARHSAHYKQVYKRIIAATNAVKVGGKYFLSSFYDKDGCWVKVLEKSTKENTAGWPSSVKVEVLESVGDNVRKAYYANGTIHTVNASNLYATREDAGHKKKLSSI